MNQSYKNPRTIHCGDQFKAIIDREVGPGLMSRNVQDMFFVLLEKCIPCARKIFTGSMQPIKMLHNNDYVIEKAFVWAIIALSKYMGLEYFPHGVYGTWPPSPPHDLMPVDEPDDLMPVSFSSGGSAGFSGAFPMALSPVFGCEPAPGPAL